MTLGDLLPYMTVALSLTAIVYTAVSFRKAANKDASTSAAQRATMEANIQYIRNSIDDIKLEFKGIKKDVDEIKSRLIVAENEIKNLKDK